MGGQLTVTSQVNAGSTFTFILPYKIATSDDHSDDHSDDQDEFSDMADHQPEPDDTTEGYFQFKPLLGSIYSSDRKVMLASPIKLNGFVHDPCIDIGQSAMLTTPLKLNGFVVDPSIHTGQCEKDQAENNGREDESRLDTNSGHCPESAHQYANGRSLYKETESCSSSAGSEVGNLEMESELTVSSPREEEKTETSHKETPKPKILLVEDNKINIMVAKSMMKQLGQAIDIANNGVEAITAVKRSSYDLVLMVCQFSKIQRLALLKFTKFE